MNILYLAHRIPYPPDKGDKLRAFRHIEHLSKHHRVWCACFIDSPADRQYIEPLRGYCQDLIVIPIHRSYSAIRGVVGIIGGATITESFYRHRGMSNALRRWSNTLSFDAAVAFSSSMAQYAIQVPAKRRVLDLCDCDSQKWLDYAGSARCPARWIYRMEGKRLAEREQHFVEMFNATLLITDAEAAILRGALSSGKLHVISNGVAMPQDKAQCGPKPAAQTVGFVGVMDYRPNVDAVCWFVDFCWPIIRRACPAAVFRIVGRSPVRQVRRLERFLGVQVVGGVEDIRREVAQFDVSVAPLRIARGMQNKVLEAMSAAKPVVLTSKAAAGINAADGEDYLVADTATEIAADIVRLLHDSCERDRIGQNARLFVSAHHRWDDVLRKFELIVTGAVEREAIQKPVSPSVRQVRSMGIATS